MSLLAVADGDFDDVVCPARMPGAGAAVSASEWPSDVVGTFACRTVSDDTTGCSTPMRPTDPTVLDDDALVARVRAGDRAAFGVLVSRHQRSAMGVAAVICGSTEEAKDIVQNGFVNAYRGLDGYRGTSPIRSWMLRVVANEAKNHVRSRVRRMRRDDRDASRDLCVSVDAEVAASTISNTNGWQPRSPGCEHRTVRCSAAASSPT